MTTKDDIEIVREALRIAVASLAAYEALSRIEAALVEREVEKIDRDDMVKKLIEFKNMVQTNE